MRCKDLDTKKFEYFCSRAAAGIGILILGFLSLFSLFYTEEFTERTPKTHGKKCESVVK